MIRRIVSDITAAGIPSYRLPERHELLFTLKAVHPPPELASGRGDPEEQIPSVRHSVGFICGFARLISVSVSHSSLPRCLQNKCTITCKSKYHQIYHH